MTDTEHRYLNWNEVFSRQTGTNGEIVIVTGAKNIGKTFGLRKALIERCIKSGFEQTFAEFCRSKDEAQAVSAGYFDKLQAEGFFSEYQFKVEKLQGFIARKPFDEDEKPEWHLLCYFVALTMFQREKKRTFANVLNIIFDEAIIDKKDRHHRYLPNEFSIIANLADTVFRQQPGDTRARHIFMLGNACDLTAPIFRHNKINKPPRFGFSWYNDKHTLLWYVEPWDVKDRQTYTLVGRMLAGDNESRMIFENQFDIGSETDIQPKSSAAKFEWGLVFQKQKFGVWFDYKTGLVYINERIPRKTERPIYSLTKKDGTIDYRLVQRTDNLMQMVVNLFYAGAIRYSSPGVREAFLEVLGFLGVK